MPVITGTPAAETISGSSGDDVITGLGGADTLNGNDGNDVLHGGFGPGGGVTRVSVTSDGQQAAGSTSYISPDGGTVVFRSSADNLDGNRADGWFAKDLATGEVTRLPIGNLSTSQFSFSPDGSMIAYRQSGGAWVLDLATGTQTRVSVNDMGWPVEVYSTPVFSEDGQSLLAITTRLSDSWGEGSAYLVEWDLAGGPPQPTELPLPPLRYETPAVSLSPDGDMVLVSYHDSNNEYLIGLFDRETGAAIGPAIGTAIGIAYSANAAFSPDGALIAWSDEGGAPDYPGEVHIYDVATQTDRIVYASDETFSMRANKVLFALGGTALVVDATVYFPEHEEDDYYGDPRILLIDIATGQMTVLAQGSNQGSNLQVSPDGSFITFDRGNDVYLLELPEAPDGADTLNGGAGNDVLDGGVGADIMNGGSGNDTFHVDNADDQIIEASGDGSDTVYSAVSFTLKPGSYVENLILTGSGDLSGTGNGIANVLTGNSGDNILDGGAGADELRGGHGDDTYYVDAQDTIVEADRQGKDTVVSSVSFALLAGVYVENLRLIGSADINGTGNGIDNVIRGNAGVNVLAGGKGDDTYYVQNTNDSIVEAKGQGTDIVNSSVTFTLAAGVYVENLTLTGSGNIDGTGNGIDNVIRGNSGVNALAGGKGNDTYYVQNTGDTVVEAKGQGTDTVFSSASFELKAGSYVENLYLTGSSSINGTGNGVGNKISGNSGDNVIDGGAGSDTLYGGAGNDTLNGGVSGADKMYGGAGNDSYYVNSSGDRAYEVNHEGADHVFSSVDYSLNDQYVENLTLTGSSGIYAKGNSLDNILIGNSGANKINGMGGQDTLTGNGGADTFIWDATSHSKVARSDLITDLTNSDFIDLSRIDANTTASGVQHFSLVDAFTNTAGQVTLSYNASTNITSLTADTNGDGVADMLVRITGDHEDFDNFIFGG